MHVVGVHVNAYTKALAAAEDPADGLAVGVEIADARARGAVAYAAMTSGHKGMRQ